MAAGRGTPFTQDDVRLDGHAIEARVYAEDSFGGFLPQAGTATLVRWPSAVEPCRCRASTLESGQVVSTAYDPMLGKVIVHGPDRESARRALVAALDETAILGFTTNTGFLRESGGIAGVPRRDHRHRLARPATRCPPTRRPDNRRVGSAMLPAEHGEQDRSGPTATGSARPRAARFELDRVRPRRPAPRHRRRRSRGPALAELHPSPRRRRTRVRRGHDRHLVEVVERGQRFVFERPDVMAAHGPAASEGSLTAPMPGTVLAVDVAQGDQVEEGQRLGVLEAMKMELALRAPFAGTVATVGAAVGEQVRLGAVLFEISTEPDPGGDPR